MAGKSDKEKNVAVNRRASHDYFLEEKYEAGIALTGTEKPEERLMKDPYFSPQYAEYDQMPPIFLSASDAEVLYDDSVKLYEKLKKEGRPAELEVLHDMIHAYPIFPMIPEARETIEKAVKYLEYSQP